MRHDLGTDYLTCPDVECPYLDPAVHEVVTALEARGGHDPLYAAQIAALYSVHEDEDAQPVTAERFVIDDDSAADWVLKKLAVYECRRARTNEMCDAEIELIEARRELILRPVNRQIEFFQIAFRDALAEWTRKEIAGQKTRTCNLLHGKTWYKKNPDSVSIDDEAAAIGMGEDLPELTGVVKVVKSISKTNAKRVLDEIPENHPFRTCVSIKAGEDVFYVKAESLEG